MKSMSFQERAKLGMELLAKQKPVTLEEAQAQVKWLKEQSSKTNKNEVERGILSVKSSNEIVVSSSMSVNDIE